MVLRYPIRQGQTIGRDRGDYPNIILQSAVGTIVSREFYHEIGGYGNGFTKF